MRTQTTLLVLCCASGLLTNAMRLNKQVVARKQKDSISETQDSTGSGKKKLVMFVENWLACPSVEQISSYSHIIISFATSYTWAPNKNKCSQTCDIGSPVAICDNKNRQDLVDQWRAAGVKVLLSFGGAGMGGSWAGDNNDCWLSCFGRTGSVVSQLTSIVEAQRFDGVDIDYEYHLTAPGATTFLSDLTTQLKSALPASKTVSHAPLDSDLDKGKPYYNVLKSVAHSVDYLMPQYYNGFQHMRPARNLAPVLAHMTDLVNDVFSGDSSKVLFGFCAEDCGGTGSNINGQKAAEIMEKVTDVFPGNGGAFMWAAAADRQLQWSTPVNRFFDSLSDGLRPRPRPQPVAPTPAPTRAPTPSPKPNQGCGSCDRCVAIPGNRQSANDNHCKPCARGGQSWWPCNIAGLCQCA